MTTATSLRIGDAERDAAISDLAEHYAAGRLDQEEYDERTDQALSARTDADLGPLFVDLPARGSAQQSEERPSRRQARRPLPSLPLPVLPFLVLAVALVAVLPGPPWPLFVVGWLWFFGAFGRRWSHGHRPRLGSGPRWPASAGRP